MTATQKVPVHPELDAHGSFAHLKLGRSEVRHDPRTLRLASYLDDAVVLPAVPSAQDWTASVPAWPMYGNDRLGDCTIACAGHMIEAWTEAAGTLVAPDDAQVEAAYIPGTGSDDTGRMEVDVLNYWRKTGIAGHTITAYAYVDPANLDHLRAAIYLFGGVYVGVSLPKTAQGQAVWDVEGDGKTGDSAPGSWGGHAIPYLAYDQAGLKTVTWGAVLSLTDAFHLAYCDEAYAVISSDFLVGGKTTDGFDLAALQADLAAIGTVQAAEADRAVEELHGTEEHDATGAHEQPDADEVRAEVDGAEPGYYWNG
jgi:hypothetical protein